MHALNIHMEIFLYKIFLFFQLCLFEFLVNNWERILWDLSKKINCLQVCDHKLKSTVLNTETSGEVCVGNWKGVQLLLNVLCKILLFSDSCHCQCAGVLSSWQIEIIEGKQERLSKPMMATEFCFLILSLKSSHSEVLKQHFGQISALYWNHWWWKHHPCPTTMGAVLSS